MDKDKYISTSDLVRILGVTRQAIQKQLKNAPGVRIKKVGAGFLYDIDSLPEDIKEKKLKKSKKKQPRRLYLLVNNPKKILNLKKNFGRQQIN